VVVPVAGCDEWGERKGWPKASPVHWAMFRGACQDTPGTYAPYSTAPCRFRQLPNNQVP
jgi:hypothetical protein